MKSFSDPLIQQHASKQAAWARAVTAKSYYKHFMTIIKQFRDEGLTLQAIADKLNLMHITTRQGLPYNATMIFRLLKKYP